MKAGILYAKQDIRYEETKKPQLKDDEVLIRVRECGICGSDIPRVNEGTAHFFPIILGHELCGDIAEVGKNVSEFKIGQKCTAATVITCGKCKDCLNGDYGLCEKYSIIGIWQAGAFAEYIAVPKQNVVLLDDSIDYKAGALIEPASVAHHGLKRLNKIEGEDIAIVGCGTIGLFAIQFAKLYGAKRIFAFDLSDSQLEMAKQLGADYCINTSKANFMDEVLELSNKRGIKNVVELAGSIPSAKLCFELVEKKGEVVIVGTIHSDITFSLREYEMLSKKEFTLTGSRMSYGAPFPGEDWSQIAMFLKNKQLIADERFISHTFKLKDIDKAFALYLNQKVSGKVMIQID